MARIENSKSSKSSFLRSSILALIAVICVSTYIYFNHLESFHEPIRTLVDGTTTQGNLFQAKTSNQLAHKPQGTTPRGMLEQLKNDFRLKPDARFLLATAEVHGLDKDVGVPSAVFRLGRWHVLVADDSPVSFLPEIPSFTDGINLIRRHAKRAMAELNLSELDPAEKAQLEILASEVNSFHPVNLNAILRKLNHMWGQGTRSRQVLKLAAQALTRLAYVSLDDIETADLVQARAMAILALAQVAIDEPMTFEESLLAFRMGYQSHARALAQGLRNDHGWRLYVEHRDDKLWRVARVPTEIAEFRYFWLQRLAELDDQDVWWRLLASSYQNNAPPIHALASAYSFSGFEPETTISKSMPHIILSVMAHEAELADIRSLLFPRSGLGINAEAIQAFVGTIYGYLKSKPEKVIDSFEIVLKTASQKFKGPFLDERTYQSFYRGYFFSALYRLGIHYMDRYASVEAASELAAVIGDSKGGTARDFQLWYRNLVAAQQGKADMNALLKDLGSLPNFGVPPVLRTLEEQLSLYNFGSPQVSHAARFLMQRMDTRLSHRFELAAIARNNLLYLSRAEDLYQSIRRDNPSNSKSLSAWLAQYYGQPSDILNIANDTLAQPRIRARALTLIAAPEVYESEIRTAYDRLLVEEQDSWSIRKRYITVLEQLGDYETAIRVASDWLKHHPKIRNSFDYWQAVIAVSRMQMLLGRPEDARRTIEPIVESYYGGAMRQAVNVLIALEEFDVARDVAERLTKRYPNGVDSMIPLLKVYWAEGDYMAAAQTLKQWPYRITAEDWRWKLGKTFAELFEDQRGEALIAFRALIDTGIDQWWLQEFAVEIDHRGNSALAFNMQSRLTWNGSGYVVMLVRAYRYLEKSKGHDTAVQWLDRRVPLQMRNFSSMIFFSQLQYSLLWELIPEPDRGQHADAVWLYRAAAWIEGAEFSRDQEQALMNYFRKADNRQYHVLGKYLLGMVEESDIADSVMDSRAISEAAFYLGLRALSEERYYDAADWYRVSIDTGEYKNGEYRWSYDRLYVWKNKGRSLKVLANQGELVRAL